MAYTWEQLKAYIRASDDDDDFVEECFNEAVEFVTDYVGDKFVPEIKLDAAIKVTGRDLYAQRDSPQGVGQFSDTNDTPIRVARDPLVAAKPILRKYVQGIA